MSEAAELLQLWKNIKDEQTQGLDDSLIQTATNESSQKTGQPTPTSYLQPLTSNQRVGSQFQVETFPPKPFSETIDQYGLHHKSLVNKEVPPVLSSHELWSPDHLTLSETREYLEYCNKFVPQTVQLHEDILLMWLNYQKYDRTLAITELKKHLLI